MSKTLQIAVLCGGQSAEHEVSIASAKNVVSALDSKKYHVSVIYITQRGRWYWVEDMDAFLQTGPQRLVEADQCQMLVLVPGEPASACCFYADQDRKIPADCVIPMLHSTLGEDGAMQGLLEILGLPYVGSGVASSAVCTEKHMMKALLRAAYLPTVDWVLLHRDQVDAHSFLDISEKLGQCLFVKPAALGSSVGISKVNSAVEFAKALDKAFRYDLQVIVEPCVNGREIECAVLGNEEPVASLPGEIILAHDFYSYEAKYLDADGARTVAPAKLPPALVERIQNLSVAAFQALECEGMARVDFFITEEDDVLINEVNTIPGFTDISMYPKMWGVSGISQTELLDDLIALALAQFEKKHSLVRERIVVEYAEKDDLGAKEIE